MSSGKRDVSLDLLKRGLGLEDKACNAFSRSFKDGSFSNVPADPLLAAGHFIYNMICQAWMQAPIRGQR